MDITKLTDIINILIVLSIVSERLVEIIKGFIPFLNERSDDPRKEGRRRSLLQILAVAAGITTALLARPIIPKEVCDPSDIWAVLTLGLLASGGSGFWNAVLTYLLRLKDTKRLEVEEKKSTTKKPRIDRG